MVEVIPAVLPKNLEELQEGLARLQGLTTLVQVDLVGKNVLEGEEGFPFWEEFDFETDIMLSDALGGVRQSVDLGASRIIVHAENEHAQEALEALQSTRTGDYAIAVGLALRAHDTPGVLQNLDGLYDYVQVMGIDHIGKQGEPPDPHHHATELIAQVRAMYPELTIQVDGGVRMENIKELVAAGATRLVVGSLILQSVDVKNTIREILDVANQ